MLLYRRQALVGLSMPWIAGALAAAVWAGPAFEPDDIDVKAIDAMIKAAPKAKTILVDVRTAEEFAVSHLQAAVHIEPGTTPEDVVKRLGVPVEGANVVLYCTVAIRSKGLAINAQDQLLNAGAIGVYVMSDGLIAWANADLPLVDVRGATRFVHPSDQATGSRLKDPSRVRFEPRD